MGRKGEETRQRILDHAVRVASTDGLAGLSIGALAGSLKMSKSGLFAHFRSKEHLQLQVVGAMLTRYQERVLVKSYDAPRGVARLRALFAAWLTWASDASMPGGCPIIAAGVELDDQPGPVRELMVDGMQQLHQRLRALYREAVERGELSGGLAPADFTFRMHAIILGTHHALRLRGDTRALARARAAFEDLLERAKR